jgi:hypothetical protein
MSQCPNVSRVSQEVVHFIGRRCGFHVDAGKYSKSGRISEAYAEGDLAAPPRGG